MFHVTNLTPSDSPSRTYGYWSMKAGMFHVTNQTPGSGGNPTICAAIWSCSNKAGADCLHTVYPVHTLNPS
jgi:hypothetical protein